jgi:Carboxypeptidase regulatory-like domain/TonB-dependent Receptor Plug Domain
MRFIRVMVFVAVVSLAATFVPSAMFAQTIVTGAVSGTVVDPSGATIAGATVTLTSTTTNEVRTQKTGATGAYQFLLVKPGSYTLAAEQEGFEKSTQSVQVLLGQTTTANFKMQLGSAQATVEVTGAPPLLQTENANIATTISEEEIQTIPNPGNDITYVAQTAPGVVMNNSTLGGYGNFSTFGLPATANLFTVDGNDYNDPFLNLNNSGASNLLLGGNDIQEVTVVSNGYTGQYGRQAGSQIDYTSKSGTNGFHGNLNYDWTGRALNANDPLNKLGGGTRPFENNNQWAASIGGPIKKDKAFFFVDTEGIRYIFGSTNTTYTPTHDFESYVLGNIPQDALTQAFYNNIFTLYNAAPGISGAARQTEAVVDPAGTNPLLNGSCGSIPLTDLPASLQDGGCLQSWSTSLSNGNKEWLLIGRVDYNLGENDKVYARFKTDHGLQPTYTDPINPVFNNASNQPQYEGQLNYTHIFSPNVVNNFLGSVLWYSAIFGSQQTSKALSLFPGILYVYDSNLSALGTGSGNPNGFVAGYEYPGGRNVTQWGLVDDLAITRGSHEFKMGFNFRRDDVSDYTAGEQTQYPVIQTSMLGFANDQISPAAAEAAGVPGSVSFNFSKSPVQPLAFYNFGVYFEDDYRVTPKLRLTMSIRAERNSGGACQHACAAVPIGGPFTDISHGADVAYNASFGAGQTSIANVEKMVFEPRLGVAWTPFGENTVVRAGVGVFSDLYPGAILDYFTTTFPQENVWSVDPGTATVAFDQGSPASSTFPNSGPVSVTQCNSAFAANYAAGGSLSGPGPNGNLIDQYDALPNPAACFNPNTGAPLVPNYNSPPSKILNPKYIEWNLEVQHTFGSRTVVSANYVGNRGYDEMLLDPYVNSFCDALCTGSGLTNTGLPATAPDPRVGSVLQLTNNGYSNYNGLTLSVKENGWHGLIASLNYTYSHALDVISNGGTYEPFSVITSVNFQVNPYNPSASYGSADYDARHVVSANYIYDLPFKSDNRMLDSAIGGWEVAGTLFWHSPFPFTVIDGATTDALAASENMNQATIILQPTFAQRNYPNGAACAQAACFTQSDFATASNFTGSVVGRNAFRGPGYFGSDFSLLKNFSLTERIKFQVGVNMYNVFNHSNYGDPWPSTSSLPLGQTFFMSQPPTSPYGAFAAAATDMRMAQIVAKLNF